VEDCVSDDFPISVKYYTLSIIMNMNMIVLTITTYQYNRQSCKYLGQGHVGVFSLWCTLNLLVNLRQIESFRRKEGEISILNYRCLGLNGGVWRQPKLNMGK